MRRLVVLLATLLVVAGCASADGSEPAGSAATSGAAPSQSPTASPGEHATAGEAVEVVVSVRDGKVTPPPHRVEVRQGEQVRLVVTSDVDDTLHVHGFDVEEDLEAGRPSTVDFTADQAGVFEVETHETALELVQLEVR